MSASRLAIKPPPNLVIKLILTTACEIFLLWSPDILAPSGLASYTGVSRLSAMQGCRAQHKPQTETVRLQL